MAKIIGSDALRLVGRLEQIKEESITCQGEGLATLVIDTQRYIGITCGNNSYRPLIPLSGNSDARKRTWRNGIPRDFSRVHFHILIKLNNSRSMEKEPGKL